MKEWGESADFTKLAVDCPNFGPSIQHRKTVTIVRKETLGLDHSVSLTLGSVVLDWLV